MFLAHSYNLVSHMAMIYTAISLRIPFFGRFLLATFPNFIHIVEGGDGSEPRQWLHCAKG